MKLHLHVIALVLLALPSAMILADGPGPRNWREQKQRPVPRADSRFSLDEVVSGVRRRNPGKVLSADTVKQGDRSVHRIRILNEKGRVRGLRFDANTGKALPRPKSRRR